MSADKPTDKLGRLLSDALAVAPSDPVPADGSLPNDIDQLRRHLEELLAASYGVERKAIADQIAVLLSGVVTQPIDETIQLAIEALGSGDDAAKCTAARTLGRIGAAAFDAVPTLLRALLDQGVWVEEWRDHPWGTLWARRTFVREEAIHALFKIQPSLLGQARAAMIGLLKSETLAPVEYSDPDSTTYVTFSAEEWEAAGGKP